MEQLPIVATVQKVILRSVLMVLFGAITLVDITNTIMVSGKRLIDQFNESRGLGDKKYWCG